MARTLRLAAAASAAVSLLVIAFLLWDTRGAANGPSRTILGLQLLIRALAAAAALSGWIVPMIVLFAAAFIPIGLYFLGAPSYLTIVGVADLIYLAATVALFLVRRKRA